jgi:hypothetical protein
MMKGDDMVKIKGSVILDAVTWARQKYGSKKMDQLISLMNTEAKITFRGEITRTAWYPMEVFINYIEVELAELFQGNTKYLVEITGEPVEKQLRGVYRMLIKLGSPEFLIKRLPVVTDTYFQGIEVKLKIVAPGKATVQYFGFERQHAVIEYVIAGFYKKALEISGAKNVNVEFTTSIKEGKGYSELTVTWAST